MKVSPTFFTTKNPFELEEKNQGCYIRGDIKTQFQKSCRPNKKKPVFRGFLDHEKITTIIVFFGGFRLANPKFGAQPAHLGSSHIIRSIPQHMWRRSSLGRDTAAGHGSWGPTHWLTCWEKKKNDLRFSQICLLGEHEPRTNFNSVYFFLLKFTSWVFCLPLFAQPLWSFWFFQRFWDDWRKILDDQAQSLGHQKIDRIHEFSMVFHGFPPKNCGWGYPCKVGIGAGPPGPGPQALGTEAPRSAGPGPAKLSQATECWQLNLEVSWGWQKRPRRWNLCKST